MISLPGETISATTVAEGQDLINAYYEPYEGMLVTISNTLYAGEYVHPWPIRRGVHECGRPTAPVHPCQRHHSVDGYVQHQIDVAASTIILDDDMDGGNRAFRTRLPPVPGYMSREQLLPGWGHHQQPDRPLGYGFNDLAHPPTDATIYDFTPVNTRTVEPADVSGTLKVASFNVLNYFATINDGSDNCGPSADMECRGAHSQAELDRQTDKIVSALDAIDADIIGINEVQNDTGASMASLVTALNAITSTGTYTYVDTGYIPGTDAIKVAFSTRPGNRQHHRSQHPRSPAGSGPSSTP